MKIPIFYQVYCCNGLFFVLIWVLLGCSGFFSCRPFHIQLTGHVRYPIHNRKIESYTDIYQHEAVYGNQIQAWGNPPITHMFTAGFYLAL